MAASSISISARHYADAAFAVARETGDFEAWETALGDAARVLEQPTAKVILTSPAVRAEEKRGAFDKLTPTAGPLVRNFLHILADRDRLRELPGIAEAFRELLNRERGVLTADVTTAVPLDAEAERLVAERLGSHLNHDPRKLVIRPWVDPTLIGGVVARIGDTLIDDSVRGRLNRLRRTLAQPA